MKGRRSECVCWCAAASGERACIKRDVELWRRAAEVVEEKIQTGKGIFSLAYAVTSKDAPAESYEIVATETYLHSLHFSPAIASI